MLGASQQNQMLAANLQTQQGQQNLQMGMDVAGAGLGLAMGNPSGLMGLAGGGGSPQLNANNRVATTGIPPTF